ncbi:MAG: LysR family transcriptional regulator [Actinomycetota bacterium]|jgi:LysR family hydrogen peroxide-inducible transcriptional activator
MELRQLEALIGIADHHSFSNAAEMLGTVQSNISSRISKLEQELGSELVDRATGTLTASGEVVVQRARRIFTEIRGIGADVSELASDVRGEVHLGMIGTAGRWIVPLILELQREQFPHIALKISEGTNSSIEPRIVSGELDLGVLAWPIAAPELTDSELFSEDLVLIVPKDHPLTKEALPLPFAKVAEQELLLPMVGTPIRQEIDEAATKAHVTLHPLIELDGLRTIASLTFDGYGLAILPATMLAKYPRVNFAGLSIAGIERRRAVLAIRRFGFPSAPVRAVQGLLQEIMTEDRTPDGVYVPSTNNLSKKN